MNKSIIITDPISSFPRDQVPFVLRVQSSVKEGTELGSIRMINTRGITALVEGLAQNRYKIEQAKRRDNAVVYLAMGYREGLSLKYSLNACIAGFRWICQFFDRLGYSIRIVLPIVKSKRILKEQKQFFAGLHKEIKVLIDQLDDVDTLGSSLYGIDPTSPNKRSILSMANTLGHDIAMRKIKETIKVFDISDNERIDSRYSKPELEDSEEDCIIITTEVPVKRRRRSK